MTNKTNEQLDGRAARAIMSLFSEQDRLARLSPAELIVETLSGEAADYLVVITSNEQGKWAVHPVYHPKEARRLGLKPGGIRPVYLYARTRAGAETAGKALLKMLGWPGRFRVMTLPYRPDEDAELLARGFVRPVARAESGRAYVG